MKATVLCDRVERDGGVAFAYLPEMCGSEVFAVDTSAVVGRRLRVEVIETERAFVVAEIPGHSLERGDQSSRRCVLKAGSVRVGEERGQCRSV